MVAVRSAIRAVIVFTRSAMKLEALQDLFVDQLRDLYNAENQILKALPKMSKAANSAELRNGFQEHLEQTKEHVDRLERVFSILGTKPRGKTCAAMEGIIEEGKELLGNDVEASVLDAGLIASAQKVEHYEIAGYGCARSWARRLGQEEAAQLLQQTLSEVEETDRKLTGIAENRVNMAAALPGV
jgi:ferritin-like metal-binding protein YciE